MVFDVRRYMVASFNWLGSRAVLRLAVIGCFLAIISSCSVEESTLNERTLNRGLNGDPESLDPHKFTSIQAADVLRDIREGLITIRPNGTLTGGVAKDWSVSDDGLLYTFVLRDDARWSNGRTIKAQDFVKSLRRLVSPETAATNSEMIQAIENAPDIILGLQDATSLGVRAVNDYELEIKLSAPKPYFLQILIHPSTYPIYFSRDPNSVGSDESTIELSVTNGAYKLISWQLNSSIELRKDTQYWNSQKTKIERVVYHIVDPNIEISRYLSGELDITDNVSEDDFQRMKEMRPEELRVSNMLGVYYVGFNLKTPPFQNNLELRAALSLAVDRETLVAQVTGRGEKPAYSWVPPGTSHYTSQTMNAAGLDYAEQVLLARDYFEQAGFERDEGVEIELLYNTAGGHKKIAVAVQSMWREALGVEAKLVNQEFKVFISNIQEMKDTEAYRLSWTADFNDAYTFLALFESNNSSNLTGYSNPDVDRLLALAQSEQDAHSRRNYLQSAERVVLSQHPGIPIYFYVSKHLVADRVEGWTSNVLDMHLSRHLRLSSPA